MKEIVTHTGQQLQTTVRQVWVYCAREAEIQDNLGQRVWPSDQVMVELEVTWMSLVTLLVVVTP